MASSFSAFGALSSNISDGIEYAGRRKGVSYSRIHMDGSLYQQAATQHGFDRQSDQDVDSFPLYLRNLRQVITPLYYLDGVIQMLVHDRAYAPFVDRSRYVSRLSQRQYYRKQELEKVRHIRRLSPSRSVLGVDPNVVLRCPWWSSGARPLLIQILRSQKPWLLFITPNDVLPHMRTPAPAFRIRDGAERKCCGRLICFPMNT